MKSMKWSKIGTGDADLKGRTRGPKGRSGCRMVVVAGDFAGIIWLVS